MSSPVRKQSTAALAMAAMGVVYGDIGTSPLYAMKEMFGGAGGVALGRETVIGAVSVIFWALMLVVTLKYVTLILRANNRGEGGIMALLALATSAAGHTPRRRASLVLVGIAGASFFYGDSVITPAMSVLSAVEGLEVAAPALETYVLPSAVAILVGLFLFQRHGTAVVGRLFGPIMAAWFGVLAVSGLVATLRAPEILQALNPWYAGAFLAERGWGIFAAVGAVVLALTGAEALYADLGHFGTRPIRIAWTAFVFPALALNYVGQGALLLSRADVQANPFYSLFPDALLLPAVALATVATIIASQATISGAYSVTRQAIQLGLLPRAHVAHTSAREIGQVYVPVVNWLLLTAVLAAAIGFGSSSALASAYGVAVTLTMFGTTLLTFFVIRHGWKLPLSVALAATGFFLAVDGFLAVSCSLKFLQGGWFPFVLGALMVAIMTTWQRGRVLLAERMREEDPPLGTVIESVLADDIPHVERTAVYLVRNADTVPRALMHNIKHNRVLHATNVIVTVVIHEVPWVPFGERVQVGRIMKGFWRVRVNYGFKNSPDLPRALALCHEQGLDIDPGSTSYFLSRETVVPTGRGPMPRWREQLFATLSRNAGSVVDYFKIPSNAAIELGTRVHV